jgi:hypothetical protein
MQHWRRDTESKPFRDGSYCKHLWIGKRTVKQGECAAIWDDKGKCTLVEGPRRVWVMFSTVRFLTFHRAGTHEFIIVKYKNGDKEHLRGPVTLFQNPVEHTSVEVQPATQLSTSEALVVYKDCRPPAAGRTGSAAEVLAGLAGGDIAEKEGMGISRRVLHGPALFVPHADEWVHEFNWSNPDEDAATEDAATGAAKSALAKKEASKFSKLQLNSTSLHYTVKGVRAADEARLDVRLVGSCQLVDVNKMLDTSGDPIQDLLQALTADVFKFGGKYPLEVFLEKSPELSNLDNFPTLKVRAEQVGFRISNIVYQGYKTTKTLQNMLDDTIISRHKHRLEKEQLAAEQQLQTLRLESEMALSEKENERERQKKALALALQAEQDKFDAAKVAEVHRQRLTLEAQAHDQRMLMAHKEDEATLLGLQRMKDIGVDLDRYLESRVALSQAGGRGSSTGKGQGAAGLGRLNYPGVEAFSI